MTLDGTPLGQANAKLRPPECNPRPSRSACTGRSTPAPRSTTHGPGTPAARPRARHQGDTARRTGNRPWRRPGQGPPPRLRGRQGTWAQDDWQGGLAIRSRRWHLILTQPRMNSASITALGSGKPACREISDHFQRLGKACSVPVFDDLELHGHRPSRWLL